MICYNRAIRDCGKIHTTANMRHVAELQRSVATLQWAIIQPTRREQSELSDAGQGEQQEQEQGKRRRILLTSRSRGRAGEFQRYVRNM